MRIWIFCLLILSVLNHSVIASERSETLSQLATAKSETLKAFKDTDFSEFYSAKRAEITESNAANVNVNQEYAKDIYEYIEDYYLTGFITHEQLQAAYETFMSQNLATISTSDLATKLKDIMAPGSPSCANVGAKANVLSCCSLSNIKAPKTESAQLLAGRLGAPMTNACKADRLECSSHSECCSSVCDNYNPIDGKGTCADTVSCYELNELGAACNYQSPFCKEGECLPAVYDASIAGNCYKLGKICTENSQCCSNTCNDGVCKGEGICKTCARYGEKPDSAQNKECCPGYYKGLMGICIPIAPTFFSTDVQIKKEKSFWDYLLPVAHAADTIFDTNQHLTPEARAAQDALDQQREACYSEHKNDQVALEACLQEIRDRNLRNTTLEQGVLAAQEGQVKKLNTKVVINTARSNLDRCEFNSLKDNWMDSTPQEKNAELMLAAFEMMFQGENAGPIKELEDNLLVENRNNLYTSLKKVADKVKRNKESAIKNMVKMDKEMRCKCLEIRGQRGEGCAAAAVATDIKTTKDRTLDESNAAGIRLEELMIEWQSLRLNLLVERYNKNAEVEEDLFKLIEKYNQMEWRATIAYSDQMYDFVVWKRSKVFSAFAWIGTILNLGILNNMISIAGSMAGNDNLGVLAMTENNKADASEGEGFRYQDLTGWSGCKTLKQCKSVRLFLEPNYYKDNLCEVYGAKNSCVKSKLGFALDNKFVMSADYVDNFSILEKKSLLDPWWPKFYPKTKQFRPYFAVEDDYSKRVVAGYQNGRQYLMDHKPTSRKRNSYLSKNPIFENKEKFAPKTNDIFTPNGAYLDAFSLNPNKALAVKCAIIRYASCGDLTKCGGDIQPPAGQDLSSCFADINSLAKLESATEMGHGALFYTVGDEASFKETVTSYADYVYHMHFVWPNLSDEMHAYPKPALSTYLDAVYYNMSVTGSQTFRSIMTILSLLDGYTEDLNRRKAVYDDLRGNIEGNASVNVMAQTKRFAALWKTLDYRSGAVPAALPQAVQDATTNKNSNLSSAQVSALTNAHNSALRLAKKQKQNQHLKSHLKGGEVNSNVAKKGAMSTLNSPLSTGMAKTSLGQTSGGAAHNNAGTVASVYRPSEVAVPNMNRSNFDNYAIGSDYTSNSNRGGSNGSDTAAGQVLSEGSIAQILEAAKRDSTLREEAEGDSLFHKVSKCYKRNLYRVLERNVSSEVKPRSPVVPKKNDGKLNKLNDLLKQ